MSETTPARVTTIEPWLREILRCPRCHGVLEDRDADGPQLACTGECRLVYRVDSGVPVLLVDEATVLPNEV